MYRSMQSCFLLARETARLHRASHWGVAGDALQQSFSARWHLKAPNSLEALFSSASVHDGAASQAGTGVEGHSAGPTSQLEDELHDHRKFFALLSVFRRRGHLIAQLDPLTRGTGGPWKGPPPPHSDPKEPVVRGRWAPSRFALPSFFPRRPLLRIRASALGATGSGAGCAT